MTLEYSEVDERLGQWVNPNPGGARLAILGRGARAAKVGGARLAGPILNGYIRPHRIDGERGC